MSNQTFKIVGRYRSKDKQPPWGGYGKEGTQYKKTTYHSLKDYKKYSPEIIKRWGEYHAIELYELVGGEWKLLKESSGKP